MPPDSEDATFSLSSALRRTGVVVRTGFRSAGPGQASSQWFEREERRHGRRSTLSWTTDKDCPAAASAYRSIDAIELPRLTSPNPEVITVMADGSWYTLERDAYYETDGVVGRIRLGSNVGTSLALWVDSMMAALQPCWTQKRPPSG